MTQTVFDRMKSERQKYISEAQFKGEAEATKIKSAAERQAADVLANAQAAATQHRGRGRGRGREDLGRVPAKSGAGRVSVAIEALENSLNQKSTLIFDERTPPFSLFQNLPANTTTK